MSLYHYTNKQNLQSIQETGIIMASQTYGPHGRDAMLGEGVYLTDIAPNASTDTILKNNYGPAANRIRAQDPHITDAYVKIPANHVKAQCSITPDGRKVFVVPTYDGINLRNIPCEYGYRG